MKEKVDFDVIIIGGSYAGLSAAMALGRSLRTVLIVDSNEPCNRFTPYSHNFITHDGAVPGEIRSKARSELLNYPTVSFVDGKAIEATKEKSVFGVELESGAVYKAYKVILATGIKDVFPNINGFKDCWGKSVIHCPYCHGYEFRNKKTGIIANGDKAVHLSALVRNLTNDVTLLINDDICLPFEQEYKLRTKGIIIEDSPIRAINHSAGQVESITLRNGQEFPFEVLYAAIPFEHQSKIPGKLGCVFTESGHIQVDKMQQTSIAGVFACGDNSNMMRSVANAVAAGNITGAMVNFHLTQEVL